MSEEFEFHAPHDHEVAHVAHSHAEGHAKDNFASRIAVMTAIMATIGAIFGFEAGTTQNDAAMFKNKAAIVKTEANDQWNFYQAKATKQSLAELALLLPNVDSAKYQANIERYKTEKETIKSQAEELDKESKEWEHKSDEILHQHHRWAQAMTAMQISIALAAIALLTRKKWLQIGSFSVAGLGVVLGICAWFLI